MTITQQKPGVWTVVAHTSDSEKFLSQLLEAISNYETKSLMAASPQATCSPLPVQNQNMASQG